MVAFYNEIDPFAAAWLRELIARNVIAPGIVDERSIEDVCPDELAGFTQCHFFAGIGVHSYALRRAGWPDDRPIWTGSCPCQPFSAAGKGEGFADERHLWPAFFHLIEQCEPAIVAGEQVASSSTGVWFDLVQADLEAMGYAFGLVPLPAAGFGGAHIRDRAFWLADTDGRRQPGSWIMGRSGNPAAQGDRQEHRTVHAGGGGRLAHADGGDASAERQQCGGEQRFLATDDGIVRLEQPDSIGRQWRQAPASRHNYDRAASFGAQGQYGAGQPMPHRFRPETGGAPMLGRNPADWLFCRDGKWRPVESGTFPLAHDAPARVGRLRGYGNAIDAVVAEEFYRALIDILAEA